MFSKKVVKIKNINIGGKYPIAIQTMTNTITADYSNTLKQIKNIEKIGADLVRVSIKDNEDIISLKKLVKKLNIPIIADIHFNHKLAIESIKCGVSKIRINPGNIANEIYLKEIIRASKDYKIPIRVGANSGSINKIYLKYPKHIALVKSVLNQVSLLEKYEFYDIIVSVKSSDAKICFESNKMLKKETDYPVHIGVTEAGVFEDSIILSSAGLGAMLLNEIGDTIRISITGNPVKEVYAANKLLTLLNLKQGVRIISCPTCGRTNFDVEKYNKIIKKYVNNKKFKKNITFAVMGCVVNGPGEAKDADIALIGSGDRIIFYLNGKRESNVILSNLESELDKMLKENDFI